MPPALTRRLVGMLALLAVIGLLVGCTGSRGAVAPSPVPSALPSSARSTVGDPGPPLPAYCPSGAAPAPTVMVVGDSISQGFEGDYTWRYRFWQYLGHGCRIRFVGPRTGTAVMPGDHFATAFGTGGSYAPGVSFQDHHDSTWGWRLDQAVQTIQATVEQYQPSYLVVELGINDMRLAGADANFVRLDLLRFILQARAAKPDVSIILSTIVQRSPTVVTTLAARTADLNGGLPALAAGISRPQSRVVVADIATAYNWRVDSRDGMHPNGLGDYVIARTVAQIFATDFGIEADIGVAPSAVAAPVLRAPTDLRVRGDTVSTRALVWNHVFGADAYWIWVQDVTAGTPWRREPFAWTGESWIMGTLGGSPGHLFRLRVQAARAGSPDGPFTASAQFALPT